MGVPVVAAPTVTDSDGERRRIASGTDVSPFEAKPEFLVLLRYREPSYEQRHGPRAEPYRWTFRVRACTREDAVAQAVAEFDEYARQSSVSWTREIVDVTVERARDRDHD